MDSLAILHKMEDITMKHGVKDWKVKVVKNFIFYNVFLIIFPILLLLTRAILSTLGNKIEILPPDNCSVKKLEMRNDAESQSIFLILPSSPHEGYKDQVFSKCSLSSWLLHGSHVFGNLSKIQRSFYCFICIFWGYSTLSIQICKTTAVNFRIS